jgi:CheY-like chemotaxis protein
MLRVLVIEDYDSKFRDIEESLKRVTNNEVIIERRTACNSGLLFLKETYDAGSKFDLVITDNMMPIYTDSRELKPCANRVCREVHRRKYETKLVVCSSEVMDDVNCDDFLLYNTSVLLDDSLLSIIEDLL